MTHQFIEPYILLLNFTPTHQYNNFISTCLAFLCLTSETFSLSSVKRALFSNIKEKNRVNFSGSEKSFRKVKLVSLDVASL
jgi:uncharacterized pyridoxamine 5'-phosphate oxidase family protein